MQSSVLINKLDNKCNANKQYDFAAPVLLIGLSLFSSIPSDKFSGIEKNSNVFNSVTENTNIVFDEISVLKNHYDIKDENKIIDFILKHNLINFFLWINQPITDIFGDINKALHLFKCWDEEDYHLVLSIFSELDDMDEISDKESKLFQFISTNNKDDFLDYVVIAQR